MYAAHFACVPHFNPRIPYRIRYFCDTKHRNSRHFLAHASHTEGDTATLGVWETEPGSVFSAIFATHPAWDATEPHGPYRWSYCF